jgi:hypothetical protein
LSVNSKEFKDFENESGNGGGSAGGGVGGIRDRSLSRNEDEFDEDEFFDAQDVFD